MGESIHTRGSVGFSRMNHIPGVLDVLWENINGEEDYSCVWGRGEEFQ
jgi:hypothetical protein